MLFDIICCILLIDRIYFFLCLGLIIFKSIIMERHLKVTFVISPPVMTMLTFA